DVPSGKLAYGTNYVWKVRYQDSRGAWSSYSVPTGFKTIYPPLKGARQGTNLVLQWPTNAVGFALQFTTNLTISSWATATPGPVIVNGQNTVTNGVTNRFRVYRLKR